MKRLYPVSLCWLPALVALAASPLAAEVKVTPVANGTFLGGQYWTSGSAPTSFGGNADVFFSPVINFSPRVALLPIYSATYSGTKDVREVVGGGTMTQETMDNSISLKLVTKLSDDLKLKARIGYTTEYLKETRDETWGKGLFDYTRLIAGFEAERRWGSMEGRLGVDYYTTTYPNYQSLASKSEFQEGFSAINDTTTFSELSSEAGTDVLDCTAFSLFAEASRPLSGTVALDARYDVSLKSFADQKTVRSSGDFSSEPRADIVHYLTLGLTAAAPRVTIRLVPALNYYDSNQNSFDIANSRFIEGYYDFFQNGVMPSVTFNLGDIQRPVKLALFWDFSWRTYRTRAAQDAEGGLRGETVSQVFNTTGVTLTYPVLESLALRFCANYRDSSSNMRYEKNYAYNYCTFNYLAGVSWQY